MYKIKKDKKIICFVIFLICFFCFAACRKDNSDIVKEISLGDNLPSWQLNESYNIVKKYDIPNDDGIVEIYKNDRDCADVYVYNFPKEEGVFLKEFAQNKAEEHNVFCNMLSDRDTPVAVLNYYEYFEGEHYINQAYIYETDEMFVEVCTRFKTLNEKIGFSGLSIRMMREYVGEELNGEHLLFEKKYTANNDRLPTIDIKQVSKEDFSVETVEPDLLAVIEDERVSVQENMQNLEDVLSLYKAGYELKKGEIINRNSLDLAFIGYIDNGVFKTRAFIDNGDSFVILSAEAEASKFQHVTNALIDSINRD